MISNGFLRGLRAGMFGLAGLALITSATAVRAAVRLPIPPAVAPETVVVRPNYDSLAGRSGKLRARILRSDRAAVLDAEQSLFGDSAMNRPGVYTTADSATGGVFSFIKLIPFAEKARGRLGAYHIGFWPSERGKKRSTADHPKGFIEVTPENQETRVSEHFRLRDFLTHNQKQVWPKYLVLEERLVDKLELVIDDLEQRGIRVSHVNVMSGFRTPQYNSLGVGRKGGRARDSRHQYGDAADVFVDNNRDGRMDDLNRDGRVDSRDAKVLLESIERVEKRHPDLVGGAGLYRATKAHGPFVHVDVRGTKARWGRG